LTPFRADGLHYAILYLPKIHCDVKSVEIARAYRLTKDNLIERMSFTLPRVKVINNKYEIIKKNMLIISMTSLDVIVPRRRIS
jgi:hypothetical protein